MNPTKKSAPVLAHGSGREEIEPTEVHLYFTTLARRIASLAARVGAVACLLGWVLAVLAMIVGAFPGFVLLAAFTLGACSLAWLADWLEGGAA